MYEDDNHDKDDYHYDDNDNNNDKNNNINEFTFSNSLTTSSYVGTLVSIVNLLKTDTTKNIAIDNPDHYP